MHKYACCERMQCPVPAAARLHQQFGFTYLLQGLKYDAAAVEELEQARQREVAEVRAAKEAVEVLGAQLSALDFHYR